MSSKLVRLVNRDTGCVLCVSADIAEGLPPEWLPAEEPAEDKPKRGRGKASGK